jgi:KAP family P-loop domain
VVIASGGPSPTTPLPGTQLRSPLSLVRSSSSSSSEGIRVSRLQSSSVFHLAAPGERIPPGGPCSQVARSGSGIVGGDADDDRHLVGEFGVDASASAPSSRHVRTRFDVESGRRAGSREHLDEDSRRPIDSIGTGCEHRGRHSREVRWWGVAMADVVSFAVVAHGEDDAEFAARLAKALESAGVPIQDQALIDEADVVVAIWSSHGAPRIADGSTTVWVTAEDEERVESGFRVDRGIMILDDWTNDPDDQRVVALAREVQELLGRDRGADGIGGRRRDESDLQLSRGSRRKLGVVLALVDADAHSGPLSPTYTLLAGLVVGRDAASGGSAQALFDSLPDPAVDHLAAALRVAGAESWREGVDLLDDRVAPIVESARSIAERTTGAGMVHSRHLLAAAITGELEQDVLDALGRSGDELRTAMRGYLERRWPEESAEQWAEILRPLLEAGRTRLVHDQPASVDELGRELLADELAALVRDLATDPDRPGAFALHLDAPWGAGKTRVVRFLAARLRQPVPDPVTDTTRQGWTTIELDAWRSSQLSPAWWALLSHLRRDVRDSMPFWRRRFFDARLLGREAGRLWKIWVPAAVVVAALVVMWSLDTDVSATITTITTTVAFVIAVGGLGSRLFSLGSIQGARLHERLNDNPMDEVAEQIRWLRRQSDRSLLLVLDDLDRCNEHFAVELLDAVQTLVRTPAPLRRRPSRRRPQRELPAFVVLAVGDHRWLRAAYEQAYAVFSPYVSEPGRPLGHLFLDKLFQVRIELPRLSQAQVERYVASLLRVTPPDGIAGVDVDAIEADIRAAPVQHGPGAHSVDDRVSELLSQARPLSPERRQGLVGVALEVRRNDPLRAQRERHLLEQYAPLLEPNPRAAKRFIMAYNLGFAARLSELEPVDSRTLALWTVVATRWPALADWIREQLPDGSLLPTADAAHPSQLLRSDEVKRVVTSTLGGPLDRERLLRCAGGTVRQEPAQ